MIASEQITAINKPQQRYGTPHTAAAHMGHPERGGKKRFGVMLTALTERTKHPAPSGEYIRQRSKTQPVLHKQAFQGSLFPSQTGQLFTHLAAEPQSVVDRKEDSTLAERPKCVCRIDPRQKKVQRP